MGKNAGFELMVLEGKWWDKRNTSVRSVFDLLSDLLFDTPHNYYYEMFCDAQSFAAILGRVGMWRGLRFVYVGAHGDDAGVYGSLGDDGRVSRTQLRNAIVRLNDDGGKVDGLFLGSCGFVTPSNAEYILGERDGQRPSITWLAGYDEFVDWIDASIVDLFFMRCLLDSESKSKAARVKEAAAAVEDKLPLARELGFQVYLRKGTKNPTIIPLIEWE